jgi:DNA-binding CsgD family transcriptional regulator
MSASARELAPVRVALELPEHQARELRERLRGHRLRVVLLTEDDDAEPDLVLVDPYDDQGTLHPERLVRDRNGLRFAVLSSGPMVETLMWLLVESALEHRLLGWLSPDLPSATLVDACERMARGEVVIATRTGTRRPRTDPEELTQRELDVLRLVARGLSNREIATVLALSPNTVKTYIRLAYRRIGVESRSQAVLWAVGRGLHEEPDPANGIAAEETPEVTGK